MPDTATLLHTLSISERLIGAIADSTAAGAPAQPLIDAIMDATSDLNRIADRSPTAEHRSQVLDCAELISEKIWTVLDARRHNINVAEADALFSTARRRLAGS